MLKGWHEAYRKAFNRMSEEEIREPVSKPEKLPQMGDREETDGENDAVSGKQIPPGKRTERWFEEVENEVRENEKRTRENQKMLTRLDMRTVWVMRLLVGILISVLSGATIQLVF